PAGCARAPRATARRDRRSILERSPAPWATTACVILTGMNHAVQHAEREHDVDPVEAPLSVSHFIHVLRAYLPVIVIAMVSVILRFSLVALLLFILSPGQRTTVQPFRLEFQGASEGKLPNGVRFAPLEIVSTPILLKVYQRDELSRFTSFDDFSRSVFV